MRKYLLLAASVASLNSNLSAGTFVSNASAPWNLSSTWAFSGDADGIPDLDDDVTILAGHTVTVSGTGNRARDLTVNGVLDLVSGCNLAIYGSYALNGSETGSNGSLSFLSTSGTISGSGTFGTMVRCSFVGSNYTISSEVNFLKSIVCSAGGGTVINNNGYVRFHRIYGAGCTWNNNTGATLEFSNYNISGWAVTLNASAANNTVNYSNSSGSLNIIQPVGGIYHHLQVSGSGSSKRMTNNLQLNGNLTLGASGILDTDGFDLSIRGNFVRPLASGVVIQDAGTIITFNGTGAQSINSTGAHPLLNVVFDNPTTVTFNTGTFTVTESFTVLQGTVDVGSNLVTLVSNATRTAYIGPSAGSVTGSLTAQRFISSRPDGYSDMASPMTNITFADWDNELLLIYTYNPPNQYPSAWGYSESAFDYYPITSAATPIEPGVGYDVYLASDGDETTPFSGVTLTSVGTPNMGNLDISGNLTADNDGWNLVGNPYAAHISWSAFQTASAGTIGSSYMYYDEAIADFATASSGNIPPAQGFWVEVLSVPAVATFTESMKVASTSSTFRNAESENFMLKLSSDKSKFHSHAQFAFDAYYTTAYEKGVDLPYKGLPHPMAPHLYSMTAEGQHLRINVLDNTSEKTIQLGYKAPAEGNYMIESLHTDMALASGYTCIILEDRMTNTMHNLSAGAYRFAGSPGDDETRFILHLQQQNGCDAEMTAFENMNVSVFSTDQQLTVNFNAQKEERAEIVLLNYIGQQIMPSVTVEADQQQAVVTLPQDLRGVYLVTVRSGEQVYTRRLYR